MTAAASRACEPGSDAPARPARRPSPARVPTPAHFRRGLTMLEVVFAVVLLGLVAVSISSLLSITARLHADNMQRLGAYEVANRIILMHLDEETSRPQESLVIPQGNYRYRYSLTEEPVRMRVKQTAAAVRSQGQVPMDRFKRITVKVWLVADGPAGDRYGVAGEEMAELTRIYDPLAALFRNPDSRDRLVARPGGIAEIVRQFSNIAPQQQQQQNQQPGTTPAPGSGGAGGGR